MSQIGSFELDEDRVEHGTQLFILRVTSAFENYLIKLPETKRDDYLEVFRHARNQVCEAFVNCFPVTPDVELEEAPPPPAEEPTEEAEEPSEAETAEVAEEE